jgi:hypothetical protein
MQEALQDARNQPLTDLALDKAAVDDGIPSIQYKHWQTCQWQYVIHQSHEMDILKPEHSDTHQGSRRDDKTVVTTGRNYIIQTPEPSKPFSRQLARTSQALSQHGTETDLLSPKAHGKTIRQA